MQAVAGKVTKVNPKLEYSYLYLNISDTVISTFNQYPNLNQDLLPNIFQSASQMFFDRVLLPAVADISTQAEQSNMKARYFQLVQHFATILFQKQQSIQKLKQLQKMQLQTA
jgi:hypothetical protein